MLRRFRTIGEIATCAALGTAFAVGCYAATTPDPVPNDVGSVQSPATLDNGNTIGLDGSMTVPDAFTNQSLLLPCAGVDREPHLPCRVLMRPTYVVGGDGVRHEVCAITLVNREDSIMVCADDTVWLS
jgi:hypothetical protein